MKYYDMVKLIRLIGFDVYYVSEGINTIFKYKDFYLTLCPESILLRTYDDILFRESISNSFRLQKKFNREIRSNKIKNILSR